MSAQHAQATRGLHKGAILTKTMRRAAGARGLLATAALLLAGAAPLAGSAPAAAAVPPSHDVIANLWEWNWPSVAKECSTVLGPAGYGGVQVAPPQTSLSRTEAVNPAVLHPWWEVYQPVDYGLDSRLGDEAQFRSMVATCRQAGVKVYVDAVINHMTGQGDTSYAGTHFTKYAYPGLYTPGNFRHYPGDCPQPDGTIHDFNNYLEVTQCELVGLSDLRTDTPYVRDKTAGYLNKLLSFGVSGFRVDAAKHVGQQDLSAIEARLDDTVDGTRPYIALEVPPGGPGLLAPQAFAKQGDLLGFDAAAQLQSAFKSYAGGPGNITTLRAFGRGSGLLPSDQSLAFVANHDSERNGSTLSYKDGSTNVLATEFLLASGYGTPQVYASFQFAGGDDSPPASADGRVTDTNCGRGWTCTDRFRPIRNMVGWHNHVAGAPRANWYDDGVNLIAFSRGSAGWIALNNANKPVRHRFQTGLAAGRYCDIISGDLTSGACTGDTVTVDAGGFATITVSAKSSVALDIVSRPAG